MTTVWDAIARMKARDDGATAVEYAIMVALIAAVIIAAVVTIGNNARDTFNCVGGQLAETDGGGCPPGQVEPQG